MALKDWKDISKVGRGWAFRKKLNVLQITGYGLLHPEVYMIRVWSDAGWTSEKLIFEDHAKELKLAKQKARQYMRTH